MKTPHVLVFHHSVDLVYLQDFFLNAEYHEELERCTTVLGVDTDLYKVVVAELHRPLNLPGLEGNDPMLPLLWRTKLFAAYHVEDGKLIKILHKGEDGENFLTCKGDADRMGEFLAQFLPKMQVYTGRFGIKLGRSKPESS
ncbi:hypothetical protein D3C85_853770 [compost metagenome]